MFVKLSGLEGLDRNLCYISKFDTINIRANPFF